MELTDKVEKWLKSLKLFALNSEVHCSREEKEINIELIGTRHVNLAFNQMIKHMHSDLGFEYDNAVVDSPVIEGGNQILLFTIGGNNYYTDISKIHEIIVYPAKNYNEFKLNDSSVIISILNWYEGLVPVINTGMLLKQDVEEGKGKL